MDDLFQKVLWKSTTHDELYVSDRSKANSPKVPQSSLVCSHNGFTLEMSLGVCPSISNVTGFAFNRPRLGLRVYLALKDVYKLLHMKACKGSVATWIEHSKASWGKNLVAIVGSSHIVMSTFLSTSTHKKKAVAFPHRCRPFPASLRLPLCIT